MATNTRGVQNGARQPFIYRGIQVMSTVDVGWMCVISGKLQFENTEDEICVVIDAMHIVIEAFQQRAEIERDAKRIDIHPITAISGGAACIPSRAPRRYSTSKRGAA